MSELRRKSVMNIFSELKIAIGIACIAVVSSTAVQAQEDTIKVGDTSPAFSGVDDQGTPFNRSSLAGKRVLINFFRGHW